ncbi:hypothetical protein LC605_15990 [Nostoc sp. CHAB 5836]|uniref:hypothetical protein n=1 Tax=Nostoc sp. CHAB 5836 TaxID=2780404 RepID=UPI001E45768B|nr:hypothetical protein [Nostoc sp. CHAB 5836]MCC5616546.1 hypothetical protein [Nostoc sp. CHAB 5836]
MAAIGSTKADIAIAEADPRNNSEAGRAKLAAMRLNPFIYDKSMQYYCHAIGAHGW